MGHLSEETNYKHLAFMYAEHIIALVICFWLFFWLIITEIIIRFRKRVKAQYWWLLQGSIKINALLVLRSCLELVYLYIKVCEDGDESAEITWRKEGWGVSWFCLLIYRIINSGSMYLHFTRSAETDTKDTDYEEVDPRKVKKSKSFYPA